MKNERAAAMTGVAGVHRAEVPAPKAAQGMTAVAGSSALQRAGKAARVTGRPAITAHAPDRAVPADRARRAMTAVPAISARPANADRLLLRCPS